MINRIEHRINGVLFVPVNKDSFSLQVDFAKDIGEWQNNYSVNNKVVLPNEGYTELLRHLSVTGFHQMPTYTISIDGVVNNFFVDLYSGVKFNDSLAEVTIKNYKEKDNVKTNLDNLTFEYLYRSGMLKESDLIKIPYEVIPDDLDTRIVLSVFMIGTMTEKLINQLAKVTERTGDLIAAITPQPGTGGVTIPLGLIIRYSILLLMDIAVLVGLTVLIHKMLKDFFNNILTPLRHYKGCTMDKLLSVALGTQSMTYNSAVKNELKRIAIIPKPIDYKKKKFWEVLINKDDRILNRGYPTSSDSTVDNAGKLIGEICKMYNINPTVDNNTLLLNPKGVTQPQTTEIDFNFNNQDKRSHEFEIDSSDIWNTKIITYTNDPSDKLLFDNPRGLRSEYKTVPSQAGDDLTIIKGYREIRLGFALGTIKEETKLDNFLNELARITDRFLSTSFSSKLKKRKGVLAVSQDQFGMTKLIYQQGGKQTADYINHIGADSLYKKYHVIDESKNRLYLRFDGMPTRMNNAQFLSVLQKNTLSLEGKEIGLLSVDYFPERSYAEVGYREKSDWAKNMKTIKVYEE